MPTSIDWPTRTDTSNILCQCLLYGILHHLNRTSKNNKSNATTQWPTPQVTWLSHERRKYRWFLASGKTAEVDWEGTNKTKKCKCLLLNQFPSFLELKQPQFTNKKKKSHYFNTSQIFRVPYSSLPADLLLHSGRNNFMQVKYPHYVLNNQAIVSAFLDWETSQSTSTDLRFGLGWVLGVCLGGSPSVCLVLIHSPEVTWRDNFHDL